MEEPSGDVSVVIPCFRSGATIERTVGSVVAQTRPAREILLVDDASGDGSVAMLRDLQRRHPGLVHLIELERNGGPGPARNAGWSRSASPLVAFLDADDTWHPRKLELQTAYMQRRPDIALTGTASRILRGDDAGPGGPRDPMANGDGVGVDGGAVGARTVTGAILLRSNVFCTSSTMLRRALTVRFPDWRTGDDYALWLHVVLGGHGAAVLDAVLAYRHKEHFGDGGVSGRLWRMEGGELRALHRVHRAGLLGGAGYGGAALWSVAKFARRLAVVNARRVGRPAGAGAEAVAERR